MNNKSMNRQFNKRRYIQKNHHNNNKNSDFTPYNYWQTKYDYSNNYNNRPNDDHRYYKTKNSWNNSYRQMEEPDDEDAFRNLNNHFNPIKNKQKEETLRVKINLKMDTKEIILYKGDDLSLIAEQFCIENALPAKLAKPLEDKLKVSLESISAVVCNALGDQDVHILENIKRIYNEGYKEEEKST